MFSLVQLLSTAPFYQSDRGLDILDNSPHSKKPKFQEMSFLEGLPVRGNLTEGAVCLSKRVPTYVCDHDTSAPAHQVITTDTTNILIRSLRIKRGKEEGSKQDRAGNGKRTADSPLDNLARPQKRAAGKGKEEEPKGQKMSEKELEALTVDKLKALLKEKGCTVKGKKEELLARVKKLMGYH